jgi:hypothetical protein
MDEHRVHRPATIIEADTTSPSGNRPSPESTLREDADQHRDEIAASSAQNDWRLASANQQSDMAVILHIPQLAVSEVYCALIALEHDLAVAPTPVNTSRSRLWSGPPVAIGS